MYFLEEAMPALPRPRLPDGQGQAGGRQESQIEKRRYARLSYREAVQYHLGESGEGGGSVAQDISETGLRLQLDYFVPANARITLGIPLGQTKGAKVMTIHGRVAWVGRIRYSDRYQVGLEFSLSDSEIKLKEEFSQYVKSRLS